MSKELLVNHPTFDITKISVGRAVEVTKYSNESGKLLYTRLGKVKVVAPNRIGILLMDDERDSVNLHSYAATCVNIGNIVIKLLCIQE